MMEWVLRGRPSVLGFCSGIVAGLVVVTPACGFINTTGAVIIGIAAGIIPFFAVAYLKKLLGYDDALDTFGVHGVGGTLGAILTGILADPKVNSVVEGVQEGLLLAQIKANPQWQSVKVIMITTEGNQSKVLEAVGLGAAGYVRKPFTADQIKEKLLSLS